jgi:hypothetical protein
MRFPGGRRFVAVAVPLAVVVGALTVTSLPAHAMQGCTFNPTILQEANYYENQGDDYVAAAEDYIDENDYQAATDIYNLAGQAFALADRLYAAACA